MAADDACFSETCKVDPEYSVLLVAPCNTIVWTDGKPVIEQALIEAMYRLLICGELSYTPEVSESHQSKIGGGGAKECNIKTSGYEMSGPVQYCIGDCWIESLVHPTEPCAFDFIYFLQPENCATPTVDDLMWVGAATSTPSSFAFDPESDTGLRPDVNFKGCNRPLCVLNDCADQGLTPGLRRQLANGDTSDPFAIPAELANAANGENNDAGVEQEQAA